MNITQKILTVIKDNNADSFTAKQLYALFQTKSTADRRIIQDALGELERAGEIYFDAHTRRYRIVNREAFGRAVFECNARGFGFLIRDDADDLFVPASKVNGAFNKDTVLYRRIEGTEDEAEIVKVLSRGMRELVGVYDKSNNARFVVPDDKRFVKDIYIQPKKDLNAKNGQKVAVRITAYPVGRGKPEGEIIQVLGYPDEKDVDMLSVAASYGLSSEFNDDCARQAERIPSVLQDKDYVGRRDLRKRTVFTIDGADAKDLDDAVSVTENADGTYLLGVHIADVSHYVKAGDAIDKEAFARGTSVYLPGTVYPMLPRELSNGICSLYQGVDRLTLTCEMTIDANGKVEDSDIYQSVINSRHRLTYDEAQALLDAKAKEEQQKAAQKALADAVAALSYDDAVKTAILERGKTITDENEVADFIANESALVDAVVV